MNQPYFSLTAPPINAILTATTDVTGLQKFVWYGHRSQRPFLTVVRVTEFALWSQGHKQF